jgi:hypothetical protein
LCVNRESISALWVVSSSAKHWSIAPVKLS